MVDGTYFFPHSARCVPAHAALADAKTLQVTRADGTVLAEVPFAKVIISARLGNLPRRLAFPDGGAFETPDNDGVDVLIGGVRHLVGGGWIDRLERSWRTVAVSVVLAVLAGTAFVIWGIPATADILARETPALVAEIVSDQTMAIIDKGYLAPSELSEIDQHRAQADFDRVAKASPCAPHRCVLLFRKGRHMGANAFALPDGRIVITDEMWKIIRNDDEAEGVFAHEMAHVIRAHGLKAVYEASLVPATIVLITGDLSQVSQIAVVLPGILIQSAYSRTYESEADRDGAAVLRRIGARPGAMADLLERLDRKVCGKSGCGPTWLGDHPDVRTRAAMLRKS